MTETTIPTLTGSAKQVSWADDIRSTALDNLTQALTEGNRPGFPAAEMARRMVAIETRAAWWIDNRLLLTMDARSYIRLANKEHKAQMDDIMAACKAARG